MLHIAPISDLRDWRTDVQTEVLVPINLPMEPLQIKAPKSVNPTLINLHFEDFDKNIKFRYTNSAIQHYWIDSCTPDWQKIQSYDDEIVWTVEIPLKLSLSGGNPVNIKQDCKDKWALDGEVTTGFRVEPDSNATYSVKAGQKNTSY